MRTACISLVLVAFIAQAPALARDDQRASAAGGPHDAVVAAVASPGRPAKDREADANRKPAAVLRFFGIEPGMTVLDMFSGGGYYTEILSRVVGERGRVHAHNNTPYLEYVKDELTERYAGGRLANVERFTAENNALQLPDDTFDAAVMTLAYHDIYYVAEESGWERIDGPEMLAEIYRALKPGGVLGIVDHVAEPGAPAEVGNSLHRIDPERARREIAAAGFVFEAQSDVLRNPDDDLTQPMFADGIRGRTDRFVFRFRKPRS